MAEAPGVGNHKLIRKKSPGVDCAQEPLRKKSPGVDRVQELGGRLSIINPLPRLSVLSATFYGSFSVYRNGFPYPGNPLMETSIERYLPFMETVRSKAELLKL